MQLIAVAEVEDAEPVVESDERVGHAELGCEGEDPLHLRALRREADGAGRAHARAHDADVVIAAGQVGEVIQHLG